MPVVVFLGPPGVGKGTQATFLSERVGAMHVSTGALLREEIECGSKLGNEVKEVMARGDLVNDEQLFQCLENKLDRSSGLNSKLLLLDGVPRTKSQVGRLDVLLKSKALKVDLALCLVAPVELLVKRFERRWSCKSCGQIYSLESKPEEGFRCVKCSESNSLFRRRDDEPEAVRHRFGVFEQETAPLVVDYEKRGILSRINGLDDQEVVFELLKKEIVKLF